MFDPTYLDKKRMELAGKFYSSQEIEVDKWVLSDDHLFWVNMQRGIYRLLSLAELYTKNWLIGKNQSLEAYGEIAFLMQELVNYHREASYNFKAYYQYISNMEFSLELELLIGCIKKAHLAADEDLEKVNSKCIMNDFIQLYANYQRNKGYRLNSYISDTYGVLDEYITELIKNNGGLRGVSIKLPVVPPVNMGINEYNRLLKTLVGEFLAKSKQVKILKRRVGHIVSFESSLFEHNASGADLIIFFKKHDQEVEEDFVKAVTKYWLKRVKAFDPGLKIPQPNWCYGNNKILLNSYSDTGAFIDNVVLPIILKPIFMRHKKYIPPEKVFTKGELPSKAKLRRS
jgi:hypothetical protein